MVSLLLTIEVVGQDTLTRNFANTHHFDMSGVDCVLDGDARTQHREGFSYYTGFPASATPSQLGSARRRNFIVLNGVQDSQSHTPWELLYSTQSFGSRDAGEIIGLIDSVMPGGGGSSGGLTYLAWLAENDLPEDTPTSADSDGDGLTEGVEFYLGRSPFVPDLQPLRIARVDEAHVAVSYTLGQNRESVAVALEGSSNGTAWETLDIPEADWTISLGEALDSATITLPINGVQFLRINVTVE